MDKKKRTPLANGPVEEGRPVLINVRGAFYLLTPHPSAERELVDASEVAQHRKVEPLSKAEQDVARLLKAGLSNKEIAAQRGTSIRTVANQVAAIFRKLQVTSRTQLAARMTTLD